MSYKDGCHPLFGYTEEEKQRVRKELGLKESVIEEDVDMILEWFEKQPHLIAAGLPERSFVERMLIAAKGSREKTKQRLDVFYRHRGNAPDLVQNRSQYIDSNKSLWQFYRQIAMPKLYKLRRITILQFTDPDTNNFNTDVLMKNSILLHIRLRYDYMLSDIWVLDLKNTSLGHLLRVNPVTVSKASRIFLDGFGLRVDAVHILGAPSYANQLLQFFSKILKPKVMDRVMLHDSVEDLYKHIPREYLPKEYGGDEQFSLSLATEKIMQVLKTEETIKLLEECSKQVSDETRRPGNLINEDYLPGTFKKLDLD